MDQFIEATQKAQAFGLQVAIEHFRRRKYRASGTLFWQFNEPWPAICWSLVDYYRRPKLAYHRLGQIYNPVLISVDYPLIEYRPGTLLKAEIWAINDLPQSFEDCRLRILLDDKEIFSRTIDLPPDSCHLVGFIEHPLPVSSQKVGANPCGRPAGQAQGLPLPQVSEKMPLPDGGRYLEARLSCQGKVISANGYDLQYHDPVEAGLLDRLRSWVGEMAVR